MLAALWLLSVSFPTLWAQIVISCPYKNICQRALLSGNTVVLQCNYRSAHWYFSPFLREGLSLLKSTPNIKILPGGSLQLTSPQPSQTGLYRCQGNDNARIVEYEIDFQDVTLLHITHKDLGQKPLGNETLSLGGKVLIFTQWEPWQDCDRCGKPGEHKRLGYCHVEELRGRPLPCWLYLRSEKVSYSRLRPELQVGACLVPCDSDKETNQPYFVYDISQLGSFTRDEWLTCPFASIYRPVNWEANNSTLTWRGQLSGQEFNAFLDLSTGGRLLQVFQPGIYKCYVEQELVAQFNPRPSPEEILQVQRVELGVQKQQPGKADSVLEGLKLTLLMGTVLVLVGLLLKVLRSSRDQKGDRVVLVD